MEFEFGTNWATYSRFVGDVFGSALAAEGIFAFFLESGFLAVLVFGWDRVGRKMHYFSTCMVCLGAHFSAVWIVVANAWQQTPAGYHIVGEGIRARAEIVDFWAMVFNPSSVQRLSHTLGGAWLAGAFLVISVSAYFLVRKRHLEFARAALPVGLILAVFGSIWQMVTGHLSAEVVARYQPAKLAAFEGHYETREWAPLFLFGWVNDREERVEFGLAVPGLLSLLAHGDPRQEVTGLRDFKKEDRPPVNFVFQTYHAMIAIGVGLAGLSAFSLWMWWRQRLFDTRWLLWLLVPSVLGPQFANQFGWWSAEVGRQPWIVYGLLRTSEGLSKVVEREAVITSLILFTLVYALLFAAFIYLLNDKIHHGPDPDDLQPKGRLADSAALHARADT
jgi:cytochrome d ubiquinol oxidase subunit I